MGAIDSTWWNQIPERGISIEMPQIEDMVGIPHIINMALGAAAKSKGPLNGPAALVYPDVLFHIEDR